MTYELRDMGLQASRYEDTTRDLPCWHALDALNVVVAHIFKLGDGSFELWHEGDLHELANLADAPATLARFPRLRDGGDMAALVRACQRGDAIEIRACCETGYGVDACDAADADMVSLYVHRQPADGPGVDCIGDFPLDGEDGNAVDYQGALDAAELYAHRLTIAYPNLGSSFEGMPQ